MDSYRSFGNFIDYFFMVQVYIRMYTVTGSISPSALPLDLESMLHVMLDTSQEMSCNGVAMPWENMSTNVFTWVGIHLALITISYLLCTVYLHNALLHIVLGWVHTCNVWMCSVTLHVHTCSGRNRIIPLMRRPNTDSTPNKPITLPRNQLLIRYADTSLVHTVTIRCYDKR